MKFKVLDKIEYPSDIKKLDDRELITLSKELREFLIDTVSKTGGHLAAGLGTIELTIALHKVFDTPKDKLIWDIGHQCYPHKILTGRKSKMKTLRMKDGISGFLKRQESEYDSFGAGHSSTSISAAVGIDQANIINKNYTDVVAIIGDGGLTAGMAYEALCHAGDLKSNILVILNDNDMSISPNVGAIHNYLTKMLTSKTLKNIKDGSKKVLSKIKPIENLARRVEGGAKNLITPGLLFEELGFKYYGPVDGHDLLDMIKLLKNLRERKGPRLLHILTKKGKGYKLAEQNPITYHGVTPFNLKTGKSVNKTTGIKKPTYTNIFSDWLNWAATHNSKLVAITPAMREGSGLVEFEKKFPERYFDVGIAEQHAITFAAGLACENIKPVVAIYSTFLQRALDQVIHDVAVQELDILLAIDRAGIVGADGETHQGIYDISYLKMLPNVVIMTPSNEKDMKRMLSTGLDYKGLAAVRYPRGESRDISVELAEIVPIDIGKSKTVRHGKDIAFLVFGTLLHTVIEVAETINATVVDMRFAKPIDEEKISHICKNHQLIVTVEDNVISGGAGSGVNEFILSQKLKNNIKNIGIPDKLIGHGNQDEILADINLDYNGILESVKDHIDMIDLKEKA